MTAPILTWTGLKPATPKQDAALVAMKANEEQLSREAGRIPSLSQNRTAQGNKMSAWQPIETAPKDGTKILLRFPGPFSDTLEDGVTTGMWTGNSENWWLTCIWASSSSHRQPTHWAPIHKFAEAAA